MGQLPEDAPFKAAHSSRNRARRMKAARAEARRLVGDALRQRDAALAELSSVKDQLTEAKRSHERECAEFKLRTAELTTKAEAAAENVASSHEAENLRRVNAETLESLESERRKTQSLMTRLGELNAQVEGERTEKEEFRQEILGLRSKMENASGLSKDEVNGLVARAQAAEEQSIELSQNMATLQNQAEDYERQLNETKDDYESLKKAVESERERADRAEGKARAAELLQEDLETFKGKVSALRRQLAVCSSLKDDLADAETKLADATARASDAESRARSAERDSGRLSRELERVNLKLAEESSRAEGAKAALLDADGVKSLALPCGLLPGEETTVALGSGFQKFRVQKIVYKSDGTIFLENERGQSVPMGTWR